MRHLLTVVFFSVLSFSTMALEKPASHYCKPNSTQLSCRLEVALACGAGYQDGCLTGQTKVHKCVLVPSGQFCSVPAQILCVEGLKDGCETGATVWHQCAPYYGPDCDSDVEFECPEGFQDTCPSF